MHVSPHSMGHNNKPGQSHVPSCCNWVWSCCCFHCSGSVYIDNVVAQSPTHNTRVILEYEAADGANQNLYGNHIEKENLIDKTDIIFNNIELKSYQNQNYLQSHQDNHKPEVFEDELCYRGYRDRYDTDLDRDSYSDRMSLAPSESFMESDQNGQHPAYLGTYQRIRHMSGLSEGPYTGAYSNPYPGCRDGSINGSFGSPEAGRYSRYSTLQERYRYGDTGERQSCYELRSTLQREERGLTPTLPVLQGRERDEEEESAYNEHFKNEIGKDRSAGEYRIPSVRVRPASQQSREFEGELRASNFRSIDYSGTCSGQAQPNGEGEKSPFLGEPRSSLPLGKPGSLVEGNNPPPGQKEGRLELPVEDRMKTVSLERMDRLHLEMNPPRDRWNLLYLTVVLHGIGTLIPWNIFINAKTHKQNRGDWVFLLQDYFVNYKLGVEYNQDTAYTSYFLQYIALAAHLPNLIFNWLNVFFHFGGCITPRIVWSLLTEILVMIVTIVLAMLDTTQYPDTFFYISLLSVVVLNMAGGVYQNTVFGLAAKLPPRYTGAVVLGSNISGTIVALINVVSIWISPSARTAAIYYFITGLFMLLACFDTYFALPLNRFYRYNELLFQKCVENKEKPVIYAISYWTVFKKCFPQLLNIFLTFAITLSLFPAVLSDIERVYTGFFIPREYFVSVTCFLTFNVFAVIGNILPSCIPGPSSRMLLVWVLLRILYIPFFLLCNYRPGGVERLWPVLFYWDWIYWFGNMTFSISGGFMATLSLMHNTRSVEPEYAGVAGMFGSAAMGSGILFGIGFSALMPHIVSSPALDWEEPWFWPAYDPTS